MLAYGSAHVRRALLGETRLVFCGDVLSIPVDGDQHDNDVEQVLEFSEEGLEVIVRVGQQVDGLGVMRSNSRGKAWPTWQNGLSRVSFARSLLTVDAHRAV
jgi:hypothetical protein